MSSIFTRILRGEIPAHRVHEDDAHLAFMDINPIQAGHVLVIPKQEVSYLFDLNSAEYHALWAFVSKVEFGVRTITHCERVVLTVMGYEVPHVHVHLIPTNDAGGFPMPPSVPQSAAELAEMAAKISIAIE